MAKETSHGHPANGSIFASQDTYIYSNFRRTRKLLYEFLSQKKKKILPFYTDSQYNRDVTDVAGLFVVQIDTT